MTGTGLCLGDVKMDWWIMGQSTRIGNTGRKRRQFWERRMITSQS